MVPYMVMPTAGPHHSTRNPRPTAEGEACRLCSWHPSHPPATPPRLSASAENKTPAQWRVSHTHCHQHKASMHGLASVLTSAAKSQPGEGSFHEIHHASATPGQAR